VQLTWWNLMWVDVFLLHISFSCDYFIPYDTVNPEHWNTLVNPSLCANLKTACWL
jgi:hypothetical protein